MEHKAWSLGAVLLEDSIMEKGKPATAGSKILEGFTAPFDAAAVERLRERGVPVAGRVGMPEFGLPDLSGRGPESAPEAVEAVAGGKAAFALCNDVFGLYRSFAAPRGLCYLRPTYGTVSRYGLIPTAASMDQIGILCRDPREGLALLSVIAGNDRRDGAMLPGAAYRYEAPAASPVVTHFDPQALTVAARQAAVILGSAELSGNLSRYDGIKFGYRAKDYKNLGELYTKTRSEGLGLPAKLAVILGTTVLSRDYYEALYDKSLRLRRVIRNWLLGLLEDCDVIELPFDTLADEPGTHALAPLAGLPSLTCCGKNGGVQLLAGAGGEAALIKAWEEARQ